MRKKPEAVWLDCSSKMSVLKLGLERKLDRTSRGMCSHVCGVNSRGLDRLYEVVLGVGNLKGMFILSLVS